MSRVSCCDSDEHIQKTIFKHKKKLEYWMIIIFQI